MAEYIFKDLIRKRGMSDEWVCCSRGTSDEEINPYGVGNDIYPPAKEVLRAHGIEFKRHGAKQLMRDDYDSYDVFVGMDEANIKNMKRIFGSDPDEKIMKLNEKDVFDPWYSGDFETAFKEIEEGCDELFKYLLIKDCIS
jgi:protein-tyrosine phosphatase